MPLHLPDYIEVREEDVLLHISVRPGASSTRALGSHDGRYKIALSAPPIDGRANEALIKKLAKITRLASSRIQIVRGERGKKKTVRFEGVEPNEIATCLDSWLKGG